MFVNEVNTRRELPGFYYNKHDFVFLWVKVLMYLSSS